MVVEIRVLSLENSHHLVDFNFESIELASVHVREVIIHKVFKNEVYIISIVGNFEDVLT